MKSLVVICSTALILILFQELPCTCGEKGLEEKTCKEITSDLTKRQLAGVGVCTKEMKFKNGKEKAAKANCILKCAIKREKLLDSDGQMPIELLEEFIQRESPKNLQAKAMALFGKCLNTTASNLNNDEEFCKSYEPLIKCSTAAAGQMCKD